MHILLPIFQYSLYLFPFAIHSHKIPYHFILCNFLKSRKIKKPCENKFDKIFGAAKIKQRVGDKVEKLIAVLLINLMVFILFEGIQNIPRGNAAVAFVDVTVNGS